MYSTHIQSTKFLQKVFNVELELQVFIHAEMAVDTAIHIILRYIVS